MYPHPNSYTYSKRLAEALVEACFPELPVCIVRPSIGKSLFFLIKPQIIEVDWFPFNKNYIENYIKVGGKNFAIEEYS